MSGKRTNLRAEVIRLDPEWPKTSRIIDEYEFSSLGDKPRVFSADYQKRGAYKTFDENYDNPQGSLTPTPSDPA